jgi:pimeloyl-ACP methyl ester carboxylesterase
MLERVAIDPSKLLGDDWQLSKADRAELARPERHDVMRQGISEAFRRGVWGYVDDTLCLTRPWGFEIAEIRVPTRVIYGLTDVLAPRQHGDWLAREVPNAEVVVEEHGGHFPDPNLITERYGWLVQPV